MKLVKFLSKLFKKDGFVLVDANSKKYIIGKPKKEKPVVLDKDNKYRDLTSVIKDLNPEA